MIPIGVKGIDEMLEGGAPSNARILFAMEPMADGQIFLIHMLAEALSDGKRCCVIIPHTTPDVYLYDLSTAGFDIGDHRDQITFFSQVEWMAMKKRNPDAKRFHKEFKGHIRRVCTEIGAAFVFVYFDMVYETLGLSQGLAALDFSDMADGPLLVVELLNFGGDPLIRSCSGESGFDLVVSIRSGYNYIPFFNFFTIEHCSWTLVPRRSIPYIMTGLSITPYISKIVVTGPAQSGKSTFVANASDHGLSVDGTDMKGVATTVAMDLGRLSWQGFDITLYGTPGYSRFDPIISQLVRHAMGVILLVDVTRPDTLPRARDLLIATRGSALPLIVVATKSDLPHQMTEEDIRRELGIRQAVAVHFISCLDKPAVRAIVSSLIEHITLFSYDEGEEPPLPGAFGNGV